MENSSSSVVASQMLAPNENVQIAKALARTFETDPSEFKVELTGPSAANIRYVDSSSGPTDNNEAFKIFVQADGIRIKNLKFNDNIPQIGATKHSGRALVHGIIGVAKAHNRNIYIDEDVSSVDLPMEEEGRSTNLDLAKLKIFTTGQSYYNGLKFFSGHHDADFERNRDLLDKPVRSFLSKKQNANNPEIDILRDGFGIEIDPETMTLRELGLIAGEKLATRAPITSEFGEALTLITKKVPFKYYPRDLQYKDR